MENYSPLKIAKNILILVIATCLANCKSTPDLPAFSDHEIAAKWADMALFIAKNTPANSPTYASRCFGYIGLTMYESIVQGYPEYNSLETQLNGLDGLPKMEPGKNYEWRLALNAGQAAILRNIYNQTSDENKAKIDSLEQAIFKNITSGIQDKTLIDRSSAHGRAVAERIFEWSKTDGGHRGYLHNFDKKLVFPERPGCWKPPLFAQSFSHHPLHPHWGKNRTFLKENAELPPPSMLPFDTAEGSAYFRQFMDVCKKAPTLTQEEKEIAIWWADDPDVSFTPPGHSYYIAKLVVEARQPDLIHCAETFAHVGLAVADAFTNCWKWKYQYFSERPNTYVVEHIDSTWESFWPDPPFPAFPSG
ncbi:MAG: phosphoesterase, partial [Bacteroidota bacterium]